MDFLKVAGKYFLISGVSNKKSVAYFAAKTLMENGAHLLFTVLDEDAKARVTKLFPESPIFIVNVAEESSIIALRESVSELVKAKHIKLQGFLHSIAFANYSEGIKPFHETKLNDYLEASTISCFSLVSLSNAMKDFFATNASVVTVSISSTRATNYGYMGPIKASLDAAVAYLAKSFSSFSQVRFNAVCAGPLKTSASAGIPGYIENYLFAEALTMRHKALETQEVANSIVFLLSEASSGINATGVVVDAAMSANYFDENVVATFSKHT